MIGMIFVIVLAVLIFAYLAAPLLNPRLADPLPSDADPILEELEEERDALFRAIRELELRDDLAPARRDELRARYEAKAAKVLRAIDERDAEVRGLAAKRPVVPPARPKRVPFAPLALLAVGVASASVLGGHVLPRIGVDATITTFDEARLEAGRALRDLETAAQRNPNAQNLLALADAYWTLQEADRAEATYRRITAEIDPPPAVAFRRLAFLNLQVDLDVSRGFLEQARGIDPFDLDTLYALGEVNYALGRTGDAIEAWESFLAAPGGAGDEEVLARLAVAQELDPLLERVNADPSEENLMALADAFWRSGDRESAIGAYFQVLQDHDPRQPRALSRIGQLLFTSGRNDDAVAVLERARDADGANLETLLFLGNAHFSEGSYGEAIEVWEAYVEHAGGEAAAGRVPSLIADARARLTGVAAAPRDELVASAGTPAELYALHCAACHGPTGGGGSGPRLANNARSTDEAFVRRVVENGRGMMPAFGRTLPAEHIDALVAHTVELARGGAAARP